MEVIRVIELLKELEYEYTVKNDTLYFVLGNQEIEVNLTNKEVVYGIYTYNELLEELKER